MKKIDVNNAPSDVLLIYISSINNVPVSSSFFCDTVEKYPQYFSSKEIDQVRELRAMPKINPEDFQTHKKGDRVDGILKQIENEKETK